MRIYIENIGENKKRAVYRLLEHAVRDEYGSAMPELITDRYGKPLFPEETGIHFSLSHSGELAMCAVDSRPVGADIQKVRDVPDRVKKRICTKAELENADFISLWCMKESFIKLCGRLDRAYREIEFLPEGKLFRGPNGAFARLLNVPAGYRAAVCGTPEEKHLPIMCANCSEIPVDY